MGYTEEDWKAYLTGTQPDQWTICAGWDGKTGIAKTVYDDTVPDKDKAANAHLIAAATGMYEALKEAHTILHNQLRYESDEGLRLQLKGIINQSSTALAKAEEK